MFGLQNRPYTITGSKFVYQRTSIRRNIQTKILPIFSHKLARATKYLKDSSLSTQRISLTFTKIHIIYNKGFQCDITSTCKILWIFSQRRGNNEKRLNFCSLRYIEFRWFKVSAVEDFIKTWDHPQQYFWFSSTGWGELEIRL